MDDPLSPHQAAKCLGVSTETVYRRIRSGKLAATRVGRTYQIPRRDVEALFVARRDRDHARAQLVRRFLRVAAHNPGLDGDALLDELERDDAERHVVARA